MLPKTVILTREKDCKHSIRYAAADKDAPIDQIYLNRTFADKMPEVIEVVVSAK